jgi:predicted extracellular nuclease
LLNPPILSENTYNLLEDGSVKMHLSRILPATSLFTFSLMALHSPDARAATTDLLISEYIEGTSFNKAIEIYNGTGNPVDLTAGAYVLQLHSNGSPTVSQSLALSGTLADGDVLVLAHASAAAGILAVTDVTNSAVINFNGDDGVVLRKGGNVIDAFGQIGVDPGSEWAGGGVDDTLRRNANVCAGDTDASNAFDVSVEWTVFANGTFDGLGSHTANCVVAEPAPTVSSTVPADDAIGVPLDADITVEFSEPVDVAGSWYDISCGVSGSQTAVVSGGATSFTLNPDSEFEFGETCTVSIYAAQVTDQDTDDPADNMAADYVFSFSALPELVLIHEVQGAGAISPMAGNAVLIEGIVVGDFQDGASGTNGDLNGFYVQEEDADADANALTSEGIFVFNGSSPAVNVQIGDLVQVIGAVSEFSGMTQVTSFTGVTVVSSGNPLPAATELSLPVAAVSDFEAVEGMYVTFPQTLIIAEYFNFDRFNETVLTSERHLTPTAEFLPGPDAIQAAADFLLDRITLDDGRSAQNPDPAIHPNGGIFNLDNLFRGGDTLANVTGVMDYSFSLYRVHPTQGPVYTSVNPRTLEPDEVGGSIKVASSNVLNYFSTLDSGPDICGPAQNQECRGADDAGEFTRQRDKVIAALTAIDADVVGLLEIENNVTDDAVIDLVAGLNAVNGAGTYDSISTGTIGTDAIKVALIYQPAAVTPVGDYAILDSTVDPDFIDTLNRPALAQSFADNASGGVFTIAVNHLKSKGSDCDDVGDPDLGDGAGNCNLTRAAAAQALAEWLATDPTASGDTDVLIIGDLNSYDKEDPIAVLADAGYTDLPFIFGGESAYSYVFDGQIGYLDYALASPTLFSQVSGATEWHINADEPDLIDYDTGFKAPAQDAIYAPDPYRSADHDPVIAGLDLLHYDFGGFFKPIKHLPEVNSAKAGNGVTLKFSLAGDYGLEIMVDGYPQSQEIDCESGVPGDSAATTAAGGSSLSYDAEEDQYVYIWKTLKSWSGTCRRLDVFLKDGTHHYADFEFK